MDGIDQEPARLSVIASHGPRQETGLSMEETGSPFSLSPRGRALRPAQGREFIERGRGEGAWNHSPSPSSPPVEGGETRELFLRRSASDVAIP